MQAFQYHTKGFTFLELLIALAIFSAGLLGILQLQLLTQRQLSDAVYISRAVQQAYNLSSLFIMFDTTAHSHLAVQLQTDWNVRNADILPEGSGHIKGNNIIVTWKNPFNTEDSDVKMPYGVLP